MLHWEPASGFVISEGTCNPVLLHALRARHFERSMIEIVCGALSHQDTSESDRSCGPFGQFEQLLSLQRHGHASRSRTTVVGFQLVSI